MDLTTAVKIDENYLEIEEKYKIKIFKEKLLEDKANTEKRLQEINQLLEKFK